MADDADPPKIEISDIRVIRGKKFAPGAKNTNTVRTIASRWLPVLRSIGLLLCAAVITTRSASRRVQHPLNPGFKKPPNKCGSTSPRSRPNRLLLHAAEHGLGGGIVRFRSGRPARHLSHSRRRPRFEVAQPPLSAAVRRRLSRCERRFRPRCGWLRLRCGHRRCEQRRPARRVCDRVRAASDCS